MWTTYIAPLGDRGTGVQNINGTGERAVPARDEPSPGSLRREERAWAVQAPVAVC